MSEEQQPNETLVNNELTERVNNAYIASNYTLLNGAAAIFLFFAVQEDPAAAGYPDAIEDELGGTDNVVMVKGDKDDKSVDVLLTLEGMEEVSQTLRKEVDSKPEDEK